MPLPARAGIKNAAYLFRTSPLAPKTQPAEFAFGFRSREMLRRDPLLREGCHQTAKGGEISKARIDSVAHGRNG